MAYTVPPYRSDDEYIYADDWNTDIVDNIIALQAMIPLAVPPGVVSPFAGATAPTGWLLCFGQSVNRTTYADLFAIIGTIYGVGNGSTTFNVPDLRGRFPLGKDDMGGSSANRVLATQADNLGQNAGEENHTLTTPEIPAHTHTVQDIPSKASPSAGAIDYASSTGASTINTGSTGGGGAHNNLPPYITLNYIVKT